MGLYMNENTRNLYRNETNPGGNNQGIFIHNRASEMVKEQARFNDVIHKNLLGIRMIYDQQNHANAEKWLDIEGQLKELEQYTEQQSIIEQELMNHLGKLEAGQNDMHQLLEVKERKELEVQQKWSELAVNYNEILQKLEKIAEENKELSAKVAEQNQLHNKVTEQLAEQHNSNKNLEKRLDNQEALTDKVTRQLDYFRSILFERTNYLGEKIEDATKNILKMVSSKKSDTRNKEKLGQ